MIKVFVYGSLKKGYGNNRLLSSSEFLGEDETVSHDYELRCWGAYPAVYKGGDTNIKGELYFVTEGVFENLDCLEGYPSFYERELVHLVSGETAWMYYIEDEDRTGEVCPTGEWKREAFYY